VKIFNRQFFLRTNLRLIKDAFGHLIEVLINPQKSFGFINRSAVCKIIDYYAGNSGHQIEKETANLGYGFIHYSLIRNLKPKRVLCIGSAKGFIPVICGLACKDNKTGIVDFVDAGYEKNHPKSWSGDGFWKKADLKKHFSLSGVTGWIETYVMTTEEVGKMYPKRKYGYIYIDGDHSYEGARKDYELFWPRLEKGGFMVFHDVTVKEWGELKGFGVWKLWQEIKSNHKIIFPLKQSGLGILQKE